MPGSHARFLAVVIICAAGCSKGGDFSTVAVSGKVTYHGQPVEGATISFIPDAAGRPATAISTAGGMYRLRTLDADGANAGQYTVVVQKVDIPPASTEPVSMEEALKLNSRPPPAPKQALPSKYADPEKSPLKIEVKAGQANTIDLQLAD
jgi:hypothetical protein